MNTVVHYDNLTIKLGKKKLINKISISWDQSICLLGESGSGKTTFLKQLYKMIQNDYPEEQVVFWDEKRTFDENIDLTEYDTETKQLIGLFLSRKIYKEKKVSLILTILKKPTYLMIDELDWLWKHEKRIFFDLCNQLHIFLFYVTKNVEDLVYFPYGIVLKQQLVAIEGKTALILKEEKLMKLLGFSLPFYANLSIQLGLYGLLDREIKNKEELEEQLWYKN